MRTPRIARAVIGTLALCLVLAIPAFADLEVTMPPGAPHEWWRDLPDHFPRLRGTAKKPDEKKPDEKKPDEKKPDEKKPDEKGTQEKGKDGTKDKDKPPEPVKTEVRSAPEMQTVSHQPMIFFG